jgi:hypothetical protein
MQFRLLYEGELKSNGDTQHKQNLRRYFHAQLKELIQRKPFEPFKKLVDANQTTISGLLRLSSLLGDKPKTLLK